VAAAAFYVLFLPQAAHFSLFLDFDDASAIPHLTPQVIPTTSHAAEIATPAATPSTCTFMYNEARRLPSLPDSIAT